MLCLVPPPTTVSRHRARGTDVAADVLDTGELARPDDSVQGEEGQAGAKQSTRSIFNFTCRFAHKNGYVFSISNGRQDPPPISHLDFLEKSVTLFRYLTVDRIHLPTRTSIFSKNWLL